jgi:hypothetical protein
MGGAPLAAPLSGRGRENTDQIRAAFGPMTDAEAAAPFDRNPLAAYVPDEEAAA